MKCVPFDEMKGIEFCGVFLAQQRHAVVTIYARHQMWWAWLLDRIERNSTSIEDEDEFQQHALNLWDSLHIHELFVLRNEDGSVDSGPENVSVKKPDGIGLQEFTYLETYYVNRLADELNGTKHVFFNDI